MSLPQQQLDRLVVDMQNHERELQQLQASPEHDKPDVRAKIEFHQAALQVGRDHKILAALGEIHDNPSLIDQLARNPQSFLQSRGIRLPAGATRIVTKKYSPQSVMAGIDFHLGNLSFSLHWDREGGFGTRRLPPNA